jgi:branched-chain amino acid transport system ATP-binding protein
MLNVANTTVSYGGFQAVCNATLAVGAGELVVLLGANGAGKTTLFRALSGIIRADPGSVIAFAGRDLS